MIGNIDITTPRDRNSSFEPVILPKGETRFTGFDDKIISMYARGMFSYPKDIRKAIYTSNAIESLNMTLRKVTKNRKLSQ